MARSIGVEDIREAIGALQSGELAFADLQNLIREALASGSLSQSDANRALRTARAANPEYSVPLGDLNSDDLPAAGPRLGPEERPRAAQLTRVRITGVTGGTAASFRQAPPTERTQDPDADNSGGTDALWIEPDPAAVPSSGPNRVGQLLGGRYRLERELGGGGMGVVYLASDQEIAGELFAVKVLKPEIQAYPDALPLLREEVRTTRALRHPNIVGVYSLNSDQHSIYMLMEYLEGKTLDALLNEEFGRGMPFSRAWPLILDMCDALAYAHDHNVIHSDLKPSNVFVTIAGRAKLLDFGIARVARTRNGRFDPGTLGALTLAYASLEMLEGHQPDQRDDVYALACVIYEMLSGRHPYDLRSALEAHAAQLAVAPIASLTPAQNAALAQALSLGRGHRTATVEELLAGLDASSAATTDGRRNGNPTIIRERRTTVPGAAFGASKAATAAAVDAGAPRSSRSRVIALASLVSITILAGVAALIYRARTHHPEMRAAATHALPPATVTSPIAALPPVASPGKTETALPAGGGEPPSDARTAPATPVRPVTPARSAASIPPVAQSPPIAQNPPATQPPPVVSNAPGSSVGTSSKPAARDPDAAHQSGSVESSSQPNVVDGTRLPAVGKHPLAVAPLAESIDACAYPESALQAARTGSVGLLVYISADGRAVDTRLDESSGSEDLDQAAVACVQEHAQFAARSLGSKVAGYWGRMRFNWSFGG